MKIKFGNFFVVLSMVGLLASCAQTGSFEAQNASTRMAAQNARTYADHDGLAKQYENTAKELLVKVEEQKKLLQHYENKSYLYGRQAQDFQSHTSALMHKYEQAAEETINQATFHHKMASELAKRDYAIPAEIPAQRSNRENKAKIKSGPSDSTGSAGKTL